MRKNILETSELWRWLWSKTRVYVDHMHVSNKWGCGVVMVRVEAVGDSVNDENAG